MIVFVSIRVIEMTFANTAVELLVPNTMQTRMVKKNQVLEDRPTESVNELSCTNSIKETELKGAFRRLLRSTGREDTK
jgi:hypothetical protein